MRILTVRLSFLAMVYLMFTTVLFAAEDVVEITVEGNSYIEIAAILAHVHSQLGQPVNRRQISQDVRKLYATGQFSDVYTEGERVSGGIKLIFVVSENPVIASVKLKGNKELTDKALKPILKMKPGLILSPRVERVDSNKIRKAYLEKGYYQVDIDIKTTVLTDGRIDIVIDIVEGDVTHVKEIQFVGNQAFTDEELLDPLASRASDLGSWFSDRDVFNSGRFEADAQLLQQFYQEYGYLDARIESTRLMLSPSKEYFYLSLSVYEGGPFTIGAIELQGDIVPSKEALLEQVKLEVGELYSISKLRESIMGLTERVGDEGFAFANVTPLFHRNIDNNTVVIAFDIEKGREVYVERVELTGHTKTKDFAIRREMRQQEGERYHAGNVRRSKERLGRLSYLSNVRSSLSEGSADDQVILKVGIEEGKSGTFSAGVTYSQLDALAFTGQVEEQNLFGEGYRANLSADIGGVTNNYSVGLTDPYFLGEDVSGSARLFKSESDLQSILQYTQASEGGSVGVGLALNEYARYSLSYGITTTTLTDVPTTASLALRAQEGTFETGEVTQSLSYDTRNNVMYPSDGSLHSVSLGYAGLTGDHKFYEVALSTMNYMPLDDFWTFRTSFRLGTIQGYDGLEAPIYRRYSLGGVGSLRGYNIYGVSLVDPATSDVLGGEYKATASLDLIFPLPYMASAGFSGAFFVDGGNVWGESGAIVEPFSAERIRGSYGFGIQWASPVGPISMIWARTINAQTHDEARGFEFALGRGF